MEKIRQPLSSHAKRGFDVAGASEAPFPAAPSPPRRKFPSWARPPRPGETEEAVLAPPPRAPSGPTTRSSPAFSTRGFLGRLLGSPSAVHSENQAGPCAHQPDEMLGTRETIGAGAAAVCHQPTGLGKFWGWWERRVQKAGEEDPGKKGKEDELGRAWTDGGAGLPREEEGNVWKGEVRIIEGQDGVPQALSPLF